MITQRFPFLLPLRAAQRKAFFYAGMRLDGRRYAQTMRRDPLPHRLFSAQNGLYNPNMGFDKTLQDNKVFNSKLAAGTLNGLLIRPGETFSFWRAARGADRHTPYRSGSVVRNGKLQVAYGGGLCQLSNLLFWVLLHSPLAIIERQTHKVKEFPTLRDLEPEGVDATISEGWIDLKLRNATDITFQIIIGFDDEHITVSLHADRALPWTYEIVGRDLTYFRAKHTVAGPSGQGRAGRLTGRALADGVPATQDVRPGGIYQRIAIYRQEIMPDMGGVLSDRLLYENLCEIRYPLPEDTQIVDGEA